jgi:hypothetical protein
MMRTHAQLLTANCVMENVQTRVTKALFLVSEIYVLHCTLSNLGNWYRLFLKANFLSLVALEASHLQDPEALCCNGIFQLQER